MCTGRGPGRMRKRQSEVSKQGKGYRLGDQGLKGRRGLKGKELVLVS